MILNGKILAFASTLVLVFGVSNADASEMIVSAGKFYDGPHAPADTAEGSVSLVRLESGVYELRLGDDFKTVRGPDLYIYLSAADHPRDDTTVANSAFVNAGKLKALTGSQAYLLPADFDPAKFKSVAVWCKEFSVLFGAAPLMTN